MKGLYKAKSKKNGEWVEGCYVKYHPCASRPEYVHGIVPTYASALYMIEVDSKTICRYTGLTDKNGKRIWEKVANEHPYKVTGKPETYSSYNEDWRDCADRIDDIITKMMIDGTNGADNDGWIPVEEGLPEEHDSIFAKWKGTERWSNTMFEKKSDDVNVTVEYEDGSRQTITAHTLDGEWALPNRVIKQKAIAWKPLPAPYRW